MRWRAWKVWAARLSDELLLIALAIRDPETPRWLRWFALALLAYALSPIDLIPDFIPVLGWLDDLLILPLGFALILRRLPPAVLARARAQAQQGALPEWVRRLQGLKGALRWGMALVGLVLVLVLIGAGLLLWALWLQIRPA